MYKDSTAYKFLVYWQ